METDLTMTNKGTIEFKEEHTYPKTTFIKILCSGKCLEIRYLSSSSKFSIKESSKDHWTKPSVQMGVDIVLLFLGLLKDIKSQQLCILGHTIGLDDNEAIGEALAMLMGTLEVPSVPKITTNVPLERSVKGKAEKGLIYGEDFSYADSDSENVDYH